MLTTLALATSCMTETWVGVSGPVIGNPHDTSCLVFNGEPSPTTLSPAVCPAGYVSACNASPARDASETVWACCPTGYHCDGGLYSCVSDSMAGNTKTYAVTDTDLVGGTTMTQVMTDGGINIHSIRVAFHSSDLLIDPVPTSKLAPATSKSAAASTSTPTTAAMPKSSLSANPTASRAGGLSTEAAAGIGVGVGIGIFLLLSSIVWVVWRRYLFKQQAVESKGEVDMSAREVSIKTCHDQRGLWGSHLNEMDATPGLYELETETTGRHLCY